MTISPTGQYTAVLRNDFVAFIHRAFLELNPRSPFMMNWHVELVAAELEDVRLGRSKRLIICLPPRHLKSFICSVVFPAWVLGHDPSKHIMCVSYGQDLSDTFARQCRALMQSSFYNVVFQTRLSEDRNSVAEFETTRGGSRIATSVGGPVTGRGGNLIIVDDFLKPEDALSDARRRSNNEWYNSTLRSRLNRQSEDAFILVNQRLHAEDIVAHVQRDERWRVVSLPASAEEPTRYAFWTPYGRRVIHREVGDVLHPAVLPLADLRRIQRTMSEYHFAAQYQQNPQPASGLIVKRDWLNYYYRRDKPERFDMIVQSWDTANKVTQLSDYSVCTTWGIKARHLYLLEVFRRRLEFPELKRMVVELAALHDASVVLVEDKASGTQLIQELRNNGFSKVQAAPALDGDKVMRLRAQTAKIEGGFVLFPREAPWLDVYLRELLSFPNARYDDQVDSTVFALAWSTLEPRSFWTDESLANLDNLTSSLFFQGAFFP